jgi:DNA helicase-2/ATP-dependent DNA helicase PcrA
MSNNQLIIAAAGSGKTTYLVNEALSQKDGRVLITTYTEANEAEIRKKIINIARCIPENIVVQTWFSFLLQHGVRPYQGCLYEEKIKGMVLVNEQSGLRYKTRKGFPVYFKETDIKNHYFSKQQNIYSDKISKFIIKCNEVSNGAVISRMSRIFDQIFIDEVQDLASYDLDILRLLFESQIDVLMVGDPRQVVYVTHHAKRYGKYSYGKLVDFTSEKCKDIEVVIDNFSLKASHRNNDSICNLASKLFPDLPKCVPCDCPDCRVPSPHDGVFLVREADLLTYLKTYEPIQLRLNRKEKGINKNYSAVNFGLSKGQSFDRVLIFPTNDMKKWLADNNHHLAPKTRAQFYVGVTRAKYSVGIVYNFDDDTNIAGIEKYIPE